MRRSDGRCRTSSPASANTSTIKNAGRRLEANAERHLKSPQEMARLFRNAPDAIDRRPVSSIAATSRSTSCGRPNIPMKPGKALQRRRMHWSPCRRRRTNRRYPEWDADDKVRDALDKELAITAELGYAPYFLTVHDIVRFARIERYSLPRPRIGGQFRRSAIASASPRSIPTKVDLLFERFVSAERREPPDIDVDFEHERREEVIQYIYHQYGRRSCRHDRDCHLLSRAQRHPRGRQGLRAVRRHHRRPRQHAVGLVDGRRHGKGSATRRARSLRSAVAAGHDAGAGIDGVSAPSLAARRRLCHHAIAARRSRAGRECGDGRPHRHRMGQGRSRMRSSF